MDSVEIMPGVRVTKERCLYIDDGSTVVLGDLHLGYEKALEEDGMFIPRINTDSIREELNLIICKYEPKRIVLLGDIKHDFKRTRYEGKEEVHRVIELLKNASDVIVVKGNHDNFLQNILQDTGLMAVDYVDICGFRMEHGHVDSGKRPVIIGHEHPSVKVHGAVFGGVKVQCFLHLKKDGIIVIPPFSPLSSGSDLTLAGPETFMSPACKAADVSDADVYGVTEFGILPMGKLGDIENLEI
ncbi:metallophosphoesterase [Candidatus Methanarcanum hacksteinii]|uniref:metallophosphoesterase n=1 Tax=Candidatus Methanarcanum hacksteinii TaxID=2911857 RepID=UPI0037DC2C5D